MKNCVRTVLLDFSFLYKTHSNWNSKSMQSVACANAMSGDGSRSNNSRQPVRTRQNCHGNGTPGPIFLLHIPSGEEGSVVQLTWCCVVRPSSLPTRLATQPPCKGAAPVPCLGQTAHKTCGHVRAA